MFNAFIQLKVEKSRKGFFMTFVSYYKKIMCFFDQKSDKSIRIENYSSENIGEKAYCSGILIRRPDGFAH